MYLRSSKKKISHCNCIIMRCILSIVIFLSALPLAVNAETPQSNAQHLSWEVESFPTRNLPDGGDVHITIAMHLPADGKPKHIMLYPSPNGTPSIKGAGENIRIDLNGPWIRSAAVLEKKDIAIVYMDPPSDASGHAPENRSSQSLRRDLQTTIDFISGKYPGVPIDLGLFAGEVVPVLDVLPGIRGIDRVVIASGAFLKARAKDWRDIKVPVLLIHALSTQCDAAPYLEARQVAQFNGFTLVTAHYPQMDKKSSCGKDSQHVLATLEDEFVATVSKWLNGQDTGKEIGHGDMQLAWKEEIVHYSATSGFGQNLLEMTLLFPEGIGPFPVLVFNHGDMEIDSAYVRDKQRFRDMVVAREFLYRGVAVAFPSRRGVGLSEGTILNHFSVNDASPLYKARAQSVDIEPAIQYVKSRAEIDPNKIILSGQSAGGYCAMYLASTNISGVIGVVDFSGGRTNNKTRTGGPEYKNDMMIDGFGEFGKATKIPALLIFAENDSRYSANTIQLSNNAYASAGGKSTLLLTPPISGDGHFVFHNPELWRTVLNTYLNEIGIHQ